MNTAASDAVMRATMARASREREAGKIKTFAFALGDPQELFKYTDDVIGFETGLDAQENDIVKNTACVVGHCRGFAPEKTLRGPTRIGAADTALEFFHDL